MLASRAPVSGQPDLGRPDPGLIVGHIAVRHRGLSLSVVARHLAVSRQSIARARLRGPAVLAQRNWTEADFPVG
jgi:hypothetical protein